VEATFRSDDCAGIAYVLAERARMAGWSYERMLWAYSALDGETQHAAEGRSLVCGAVSDDRFGARWNQQWAELQRVAAQALLGALPNPAPGAHHYGSPQLANDVQRGERAVRDGRWSVVRTSTANIFYRVRRSRVVPASKARGLQRSSLEESGEKKERGHVEETKQEEARAEVVRADDAARSWRRGNEAD